MQPGWKAFNVVPFDRFGRVIHFAGRDRIGQQQRPLAEEVAALFDQFRGSLLRYLSSFGLALPDGEEVLQEVFLRYFNICDSGKSRENIRGWLFRVAHNLALKQAQCDPPGFGGVGGGGAETGHRSIPNPEDQMATVKLSSVCWQSSKRCRNRIGGVSFCGPKVCAIGRSPRFSTCPSVGFPCLWPDLWRASRVAPNGADS